MKKRKCMLYLQHKLPWETDWNDVATGDSIGCKNFLKILKKEPPHLIAVEYRIVEKKNMKVNSQNKTVTYPVCIINGSDIASNIKGQKRNE